MLKKSIVFLLCCSFLQLNAQIRYQKFYDAQQQKAAVEGMMTDDSVRTGDWTWWHQNGRVYQQGKYNEHGEKVGTWKVFYDDGSKCAEECYGNGTSREWYQNGNLKSEVTVANGLKQGTVKVGVFSSVCTSWMPDIIKSFSELYPAIEIEVFQGTYDDVSYWIRNGIVDFGFLSMSSAPASESFRICCACESDGVACA